MVDPGRRSSDAFIGQVLPSRLKAGVSYAVERRLGQGGTATAYLCRRRAPDGEAPVVVKIILPQIVAESDEQALTIIKKEAVALGRLNERVPPSPNVVRLIDTGSVSLSWHSRTLELPWVALEYVHGGVEGTSLEERVNFSVRTTGYAFDPTRVARALTGIAGGLGEIHAAGIVHRDLTPGNVLTCGSGETEIFKISDFGIARPQGLAATFGDALVGTLGYAAPELFLPKLGLGPHTDLFSLGAIVFFMLTGERLFEGSSPGEAMLTLQSPERRSIRTSPTLSFELRESEAAVSAIDQVLARATAYEPWDRPANARALAESLMPWLLGDAPADKPSRRWVTSMGHEKARDLALDTTWMMRHPPGDDRVVTDVAWNAAGQALAATTDGLAFWDGSRWAGVTASDPATLGPVSCVERLGPTRWLVGSAGGRLSELSHEGLRELVCHPDQRVTFTGATPDFDDVAVLVGDDGSGTPALHTMIGRRWLRPVPVRGAQSVTDLSRIDDERWLVVGRSDRGTAYAAIYRPLAWELEPLPAPAGRVLLASASRPERHAAVAVGVGGAVLTIDTDQVRVTTLLGGPDLASVGIDALGRSWAAGRGRVWSRRGGGEWTVVWEHAEWQPPFIGIMVEVGAVVAMSVNGAVLECRSMPLDKTYPSL